MPLIITPRQLNQRAELYHQLGHDDHRRADDPQGPRTSAKPSALPFFARSPSREWLEQLNQGQTVSEVVRRIGKWIPSFDLALIEAGERSGRLDACFKLLAVYYRERAQMAQQMISDMLYPALRLQLRHRSLSVHRICVEREILRGLWSMAIVAIAALRRGLSCYLTPARDGMAKRGAPRSNRFCAAIPILGTARRTWPWPGWPRRWKVCSTPACPSSTAWELAATASGSPALDRTVQSWKEPLEEGSTSRN